MRRLHTTGRRERFVASGVYLEPDGMEEHWSIHEVGAGARFIRVDRDGRNCGRRSLLQEALRNSGGVFERIDQQLYGLDGHATARLRCTRFRDRVEITHDGRTALLDTAAAETREIVFLAPGILLSGMALSRASAGAGSAEVLQIAMEGDGFDWELRTLAACCGSPVPIGPETGALAARPCLWRGSDRIHWLDAHGVTLRLEEDGRSTGLSRYARRHD